MKVSKQDLIDIMTRIGPIPPESFDFPEEVLAQSIGSVIGDLFFAIYDDIQNFEQFIETINQHLVRVEHPADSDCWCRRAQALETLHVLHEKLVDTEALAAAVHQILDKNPMN